MLVAGWPWQCSHTDPHVGAGHGFINVLSQRQSCHTCQLRRLLLPLGVQGGDCTDGSEQDFGRDGDVQGTIIELVMETRVCASGCSGVAAVVVVVVLILHVPVVVVGGGALVVVVVVVVVLLVVRAVLDAGLVCVLLC